ACGDPGRHGPAVDVYALGAILYEMLTGRRPFQALTPLETLQALQTAEPVPPRLLVPRLPRDLEVICLKCMEKEPDRRYRHAGELAVELCRFLRGEPIHARPIGRAARGWRWFRRNRVVAALATAIVVTLGVGLAFSSYFASMALQRG